jgi:hypothetical protein
MMPFVYHQPRPFEDRATDDVADVLELVGFADGLHAPSFPLPRGLKDYNLLNPLRCSKSIFHAAVAAFFQVGCATIPRLPVEEESSQRMDRGLLGETGTAGAIRTIAIWCWIRRRKLARHERSFPTTTPISILALNANCMSCMLYSRLRWQSVGMTGYSTSKT